MVSTSGHIGPLPQLPRSLFLSKGGFGEVYRDPRGNGLCVKRFNKPLQGDAARRLQRLIDLAANSRPEVRSRLVDRLSWPIEAFGTSIEIHGYSMPEAPPEAWFTLTSVKRDTTQLLQLKYLISPSYWAGPAITSAPPNVSEQDRLAIAVDFHDVLSLLHDCGLVYGDISANNVCVRRSSPMRVFLLDADSIMTPHERVLDHQQSPDWDVPVVIDTVAEERSRFALLVWRLLREDQFERPNTGTAQWVDAVSRPGMGQLLIDLYLTGETGSFQQAGLALRSALSATTRNTMFAADMASGFAKRVAAWPTHLLDKQQQGVLVRARSHLTTEELIRSAHGFEKRILLRTAAVDSTFRLDLEPGVEVSPTPRTVQELEQLVFDAQFAAIAGHLASGSLQQFESHLWVERSARHALAGAEEIEPSIAARVDRATISWSWPPDQWVNAVVLDVVVAGQHVRDVVLREQADRSAVREIASAPGSGGRVRITPAIRSPKGSLIPGRSGREWTFTTPVPPAPPRPHRQRSGGPWPDPAVAPIIVDPAAEARAAEDARRRRKRRRLVAALGTLGLIGVTSLSLWYFLRPEPRRLVASSTPYGLRLEWPLPPKDQPVSELLIQVSATDKDDWQTRRRLAPNETNVVMPKLGVDRLYRVIATSTDSGQSGVESIEYQLGGTVLVVGTKPPGSVQAKAEKVNERVYRVTWTAPADASIARYEVQVRAQWSNRVGTFDTFAFVDAPTASTTVSAIGESNKFYIRAVNIHGQAGPWTELEQ